MENPEEHQSNKLPYNIYEMIRRIREAVKDFPKAAMFQLADEGYNLLFEQIVACIISIRTYDEVTVVAARRLFSRAQTPEDMLKLSEEEIDQLIHPCTFHEPKSKQIRAIAARTGAEFGGVVPCDIDTVMSFTGVGIKCANLALGVACGQARISVDVHVHRVTNRWGYIHTKTLEETTRALEEKLPKEYWIEINKLLVPFGKHICTGKLPKCSTCPVLAWCRQVGITSHC